jgi:hypothetical protein
MYEIGFKTHSNTRNVVAMTSEMKCYTVAHVRERKTEKRREVLSWGMSKIEFV